MDSDNYPTTILNPTDEADIAKCVGSFLIQTEDLKPLCPTENRPLTRIGCFMGNGFAYWTLVMCASDR